MIHPSFVDATALPRVVWLRPNLVGLAFPLMKLLPARYIVRKALEEGELLPGGPIAEPTSGTFGLALAMVARGPSGTGRLFARTARETGFAPVRVAANRAKHAFLADEDAPEGVGVPRIGDDALRALLERRFGGGGAGVTFGSEDCVATAAAVLAGDPSNAASGGWGAVDGAGEGVGPTPSGGDGCHAAA